MSGLSGKQIKDLKEAYASIYADKSDNLAEDIAYCEDLTENLEIYTDLLVDVLAEKLVLEGYANTEDQAFNTIPHMSDVWLDGMVANFVLEQSFIDAVNSLVEEGYDLSSYTVDELYENYIQNFSNVISEEYGNINEVAIAAPLVWPGIAAASTALLGGAAKLYQGMQKRKTDPASQRWLETGSFEARKGRVDNAKRDKAKERLKQRQSAQQPAAQQQSGGTTPPPKPPKPPKGPGPFEKAKALFKKGLGLQPGQSATKELGKKVIVKGGEAVRGIPKIASSLKKRDTWTKALKYLGAAEVGAIAGKQGNSPTGVVLKTGGDILKGAGKLVQGAPEEAGAIKQGIDAYQKAKEKKEKKTNDDSWMDKYMTGN